MLLNFSLYYKHAFVHRIMHKHELYTSIRLCNNLVYNCLRRKSIYFELTLTQLTYKNKEVFFRYLKNRCTWWKYWNKKALIWLHVGYILKQSFDGAVWCETIIFTGLESWKNQLRSRNRYCYHSVINVQAKLRFFIIYKIVRADNFLKAFVIDPTYNNCFFNNVSKNNGLIMPHDWFLTSNRVSFGTKHVKPPKQSPAPENDWIHGR